MVSKEDLKAYVTEHIDLAIENEDIKVYYQPIIRTITGEVCGKEALARWDDPEYGLLEPRDFIPILEENRLIHKLDSFVIKKICSHYDHCAGRKDPLIPISFNLSWLDFELCDVIKVLNSEVEKNRMPREMIRVEINESLIVHDRDFIGEKLRELHEEGYEIIMDDFGSGHSSLNILKKYVYDELKIDMRLLWGDDDRSKKLIEHLISLAKSVGIKTTAESVETKEQMGFLRHIGCEKLQGFYFGEPMFYWDLVPYLKEKGMSTEPIGMKGYYDRIGQTDIREKQNGSYAIVEFTEDRANYLFLNEEYKENIRSIGITDLMMLESLCNDTESELNTKFMQMIRRAKERNAEQIMDFVWKGNYCIVRFAFLTGNRKKDAYEVELVNLSKEKRVNHLQKINDALEGVYSVFDRVVQLDITKDRVNTLYRETGYAEKYDSNSYSENINKYINSEIYADDRERYRQFSDIKNVEERIGKSGRNYIAGCFRFKNQNGNYVWREQYFILAREHENDRKFLICTKEVDEKQLALLLELSSIISGESGRGKGGKRPEIEDDILWKTMVETCPVGIFWKDKNRRFLGVNKAFLDYYGFESEEEVLGKNDEDMNWHVDPVPFKEEEESVLKNGTIIRDSIGRCIARGENRDILVNKAPVYKDGKIVGILGYFRDITERTNKYSELKTASMTDKSTGVLNIKGLMDSVVRYESAYRDNKQDFAIAVFHIDQYKEIRDEFGADHCDKVMAAVADKILKKVGTRAVVGRPASDIFLVIRQVESSEEGPSFMQSISNEISSLREVDNIPCTIYSSAGFAAYSEAGGVEALYSAAMKRMNDQMERMRRFTGGF